MINYPLGAFVEKTAAWMYEHLLIVCQSFKAFCGVFFGSMVEETSADSLPYLVVFLHVMGSTRYNWQLKPIKDL